MFKLPVFVSAIVEHCHQEVDYTEVLQSIVYWRTRLQPFEFFEGVVLKYSVKANQCYARSGDFLYFWLLCGLSLCIV